MKIFRLKQTLIRLYFLTPAHCYKGELQCGLKGLAPERAILVPLFILYFTVKPNVYQNLIKLVFSLI